MDRERADRLLVRQGLVASRAEARAAILAGQVHVAGVALRRADLRLPIDAPLECRAPPPTYVSRGGIKLAAALDHFALDPAGAVALDLGASTGGFVDVLLSRGAARVYAVDVGHGQLHPRLRCDPRVIVMERTDARTLTRALLGDAPSFLTADLSFIGLAKALGPALALAAPGARLVALVKPQFEVGPGRVGKGGIVRDEASRHAALVQVVDWLETRGGWTLLGTMASPLAGGDGNREYLLAARHDG